jgi:hypothetical protein
MGRSVRTTPYGSNHAAGSTENGPLAVSCTFVLLRRMVGGCMHERWSCRCPGRQICHVELLETQMTLLPDGG